MQTIFPAMAAGNYSDPPGLGRRQLQRSSRPEAPAISAGIGYNYMPPMSPCNPSNKIQVFFRTDGSPGLIDQFLTLLFLVVRTS